VLDGFVGAVVGGFEFAGRLVSGVRGVMEAAVGERTIEFLGILGEKRVNVLKFNLALDQLH
jgi:K+-transporting ATPase c subunit